MAPGKTLIIPFSLLLSLAGLILLVYFGFKARPKIVRAYYDKEELEVAETLKNME